MKPIPPLIQLNKTYLFTLVAIVFVASILRLYGWYNMPYQHDELSALMRLNFSSIGELFSKGIMVDGHPALIQCFLFIWTNIFGTAEWIVKLPFVVCGILAVYFTWRLAYKWASPITALYCAAFIAVLQLPVFHSLHARPYAPGMLLILWFALEWTNWQQAQKITKNMYVRYVIVAILCALCHHFVALGAILIGVTGLFTINKPVLKNYILANILVILCYLPYLPVTLAQLKFGGLGGENGWLTAPENTFILDYFKHVFMYSPVLLLLVFGVLLFSHPKKTTEIFYSVKYRIIALLLFFMPLLIGLFYSWSINPIIQFSLLVFFLPFLFIFLFPADNSNLSKKIYPLFVLLILSVGSITLLKKRQFSEMSHTSIFRDAFTLTNDVVNKNNIKAKDCFFVFNENADYLNFYNRNKINFTSYLSKTDEDFFKSLHTENKPFTFLANPTNHILAVTNTYYKYLYVLKQSFNCEIYLATNSLLKDQKLITLKNKYSILKNKMPINQKSHFKLMNKDLLELDATQEFGFGIKGNFINSINFSDIIEFKAVLECERPGTKLVFEANLPNGKKFWNASTGLTIANDKKIISFLIRGQNIAQNKNLFQNSTFSAYVWNAEKQKIIITDFSVSVYEGNPRLYSVTNSIEK